MKEKVEEEWARENIVSSSSEGDESQSLRGNTRIHRLSRPPPPAPFPFPRLLESSGSGTLINPRDSQSTSRDYIYPPHT